MSLRVCRGCGEQIIYRGRGRPGQWCLECEESGEKQRAYREANKDEIAEKKRAYYEANKDEIAEKKRASRTCAVCGDSMRHPSETGMCGFCEDETYGTVRKVEAA